MIRSYDDMIEFSNVYLPIRFLSSCGDDSLLSFFLELVENPTQTFAGSFARRKGGGYLLVKASSSEAEDESRGSFEIGKLFFDS